MSQGGVRVWTQTTLSESNYPERSISEESGAWGFTPSPTTQIIALQNCLDALRALSLNPSPSDTPPSLSPSSQTHGSCFLEFAVARGLSGSVWWEAGSGKKGSIHLGSLCRWRSASLPTRPPGRLSEGGAEVWRRAGV